MSGTIKGITIRFEGDTTRLDKALRQINNETKSIDRELKQVNNALKFNPTNVELWRQKQELLSQKISETKKKLDTLKQAQAKMDADGVDKNSEEYRKLQREIIVAENQVKTFEGQLREIGNVKLRATSEQIKEMGDKLTSAGNAMRGLSTAGAVVTASIGALAYKAGVAADDLNTLSKTTGIGTGKLQQYGAAADLVDVSVEAIAKSNQKLKKGMYAAEQGSKTQAAAFEKLGVSVTKSDGTLRDSDAVFQDVITALGGMKNETERDALAMTLLGKSASELNPLIEDGGETYKNVAETLKKYDLEMVSQEDLNAANQFNDSLDTMKVIGTVALQTVGTQLAAYLAPALEKVVGWIGRLAQWLSNLSPQVLTVIGVVGSVVAVMAPLLITVGKMATGISAIIKLIGIVGPAIGGIVTTLGPVVLAIAAVIAIGVLLYKNWDTIKAKAVEIWKKVTATFNKLKASVIAVWNGIKTAINTAWTNIKTGVTTAVNAVKTKVSSVFSALKEKVKSVWTGIKEAITNPIKTAKEKVKGIVDKIKDYFPLKLGKILNFSLPKITIGTTEKTVGGKTIKVPDFSISWASHALGGIITKRMLMQSGNTIHEFGEAGPEAIIPLNKFWDKLDNMSMGETTINIVINGAGDPRAVADEVKRMLIRETNQRRLAWQ